jgi:hypothetical protein
MAGAFSVPDLDPMTSANSLSLRRLDEIERKLDHMLEELRRPSAIRHVVAIIQGRTERPLVAKWCFFAPMHPW